MEYLEIGENLRGGRIDVNTFVKFLYNIRIDYGCEIRHINVKRWLAEGNYRDQAPSPYKHSRDYAKEASVFIRDESYEVITTIYNDMIKRFDNYEYMKIAKFAYTINDLYGIHFSFFYDKVVDVDVDSLIRTGIKKQYDF